MEQLKIMPLAVKEPGPFLIAVKETRLTIRQGIVRKIMVNQNNQKGGRTEFLGFTCLTKGL